MEQRPASQSQDVNAVHAKPFSKMTPTQKLSHIGKVIVFVVTFGFAFPNIFIE